MRNIFFVLCFCLMCSGCDILENSVSDVYGWDLSACVGNFSTCWELFWDNSDKFEGGFVNIPWGVEHDGP